MKPFDNPQVRQAVNFAIDKRALQRLFGGLLTPSCNFLPPGMQGYQKIDPCPYGDPKAAPNLAKAKQMIQQAGVAGQSVTVYGNDEELTRNVTEYLASVLTQIGLKPQLRIVNGDVYFQTIGNQDTKAAAGFANWFQDYPHPYNFMFLIDGASIQNTNNQNFGNVDDPKINSMLAAANKKDISEAAPEYAAVDKHLVEQGTSSRTATASCRSSCRTGWTSSPPCSTRCCRPCTRRSPSRARTLRKGGARAALPLPAPAGRLIISSKARGSQVTTDPLTDYSSDAETSFEELGSTEAGGPTGSARGTSPGAGCGATGPRSRSASCSWRSSPSRCSRPSTPTTSPTRRRTASASPTRSTIGGKDVKSSPSTACRPARRGTASSSSAPTATAATSWCACSTARATRS